MYLKLFVLFELLLLGTLWLLTSLGYVDLKEILGPTAIILSSVGAVVAATYTLVENTRLNRLNTTIKKVDENFPLRNSSYSNGVRKITNALIESDEAGVEISFERLDHAVKLLDEKEHKAIKNIVNYYNDIARGVLANAYDEDWALNSLSGVHITIWMECWPFMIWHRLIDEAAADTYNIRKLSGVTPMYSSFESWVKSQIGNRKIRPLPHRSSIPHTAKLAEPTKAS